MKRGLRGRPARSEQLTALGEGVSITAVSGLSASQRDEIALLRRLCETAGGTDLKLSVRAVDEGMVPGQFLATLDGGIVGYAGVDLGADAEVCGMVHPEHRRHGIGAALLRGALAATRALGRDSALVICEEAEPMAMEWLLRSGGVINSTELRMVLRLDAAVPGFADRGRTVDLRPCDPEDRDHLIRLISDGFPHSSPEVTATTVSRHAGEGQEALLAWDGDDVVATLSLIHVGERWMIYGVVVDSARRGRGYGGAVMRAALERLRSQGAVEVSLEVEPDNVPSVRLYTGLGFRTSTTYRYVRLPVGALENRR